MCPVVLLAECLENVAFSPHVHGKCIIYTMYIVHITLYVFLLNYVYWSLSYTYTRQGNSPYPCPGLCLYWRAPLLYTTNSMMLIAAALSLASVSHILFVSSVVLLISLIPFALAY